MNESSCCSPSLLVFGVVIVLDLGYSNRHVMVSHFCSNMPFANDIWCGVSFHMLFAIYVSLLVGCLFSSLTHCLNMLFLSLLLSFMSSLCVWNNSPLSNISFEIFSPFYGLSSHSFDSVFHEAEVLNSLTNQYITLLNVCICLKAHYLIDFINSRILNSQPQLYNTWRELI